MSDAPTPTRPPASTDKTQFWTETIAAFTASGLSVRAFCAARGLSEKRFYTWRRNLGLSPVAPPLAASDAPARKFVPVRLDLDSRRAIEVIHRHPERRRFHSPLRRLAVRLPEIIAESGDRWDRPVHSGQAAVHARRARTPLLIDQCSF